MKKRYAVIAGAAIAIPCGGAMAHGQDSSGVGAPATWAAMDANTDGALTSDEVEGTPWAQGFGQMDANGDGRVTRQEYDSYIRAKTQAQSDKQDKES